MEGSFLSWMIGSVLDKGVKVFDKLPARRLRKGKRVSFVLRIWEKERGFRHIMRLVGESFSFGLMLFSIGFCATLLYLIYVYFT